MRFTNKVRDWKAGNYMREGGLGFDSPGPISPIAAQPQGVQMDRFDALVANAPPTPREFVMWRMGWPVGLRLYAAYQPHEGEEWLGEQPKVDSYEDRWNIMPFEQRIRLGLEWRLWYAIEMNRMMEDNGPLHTIGRVDQMPCG